LLLDESEYLNGAYQASIWTKIVSFVIKDTMI